ncbi:MAG: CPBP family intramembrane metalloprotease [Lentimicrobiaceae bacterium]|nr:CPBP family intramembrane metalloprotease [Lentimicrobiaceae bacterium]
MNKSTETSQKLPVWWIFILVPMGIVLTTIAYEFIRPEILEFKNFLGISQGRIFSLLLYTFSTGIAVSIYFLLLKHKGLNFHKAGYRYSISGKGLIYSLVCVSIAIFCYPLIESFLKLLHISMYWGGEISFPVQQKENQDIYWGVLTAVILAPLTEDTIFRGYVVEMFKERMGKWVTITLSSLIFALVHLQFFGPGLTIYMLVWSILTCFLYVKFNNIYPSLIFHALNNIWAYIFVPMIFK